MRKKYLDEFETFQYAKRVASSYFPPQVPPPVLPPPIVYGAETSAYFSQLDQQAPRIVSLGSTVAAAFPGEVLLRRGGHTRRWVLPPGPYRVSVGSLSMLTERHVAFVVLCDPTPASAPAPAPAAASLLSDVLGDGRAGSVLCVAEDPEGENTQQEAEYQYFTNYNRVLSSFDAPMTALAAGAGAGAGFAEPLTNLIQVPLVALSLPPHPTSPVFTVSLGSGSLAVVVGASVALATLALRPQPARPQHTSRDLLKVATYHQCLGGVATSCASLNVSTGDQILPTTSPCVPAYYAYPQGEHPDTLANTAFVNLLAVGAGPALRLLLVGAADLTLPAIHVLGSYTVAPAPALPAPGLARRVGAWVGLPPVLEPLELGASIVFVEFVGSTPLALIFGMSDTLGGPARLHIVQFGHMDGGAFVPRTSAQVCTRTGSVFRPSELVLSVMSSLNHLQIQDFMSSFPLLPAGAVVSVRGSPGARGGAGLAVSVNDLALLVEVSPPRFMFQTGTSAYKAVVRACVRAAGGGAGPLVVDVEDLGRCAQRAQDAVVADVVLPDSDFIRSFDLVCLSVSSLVPALHVAVGHTVAYEVAQTVASNNMPSPSELRRILNNTDRQTADLADVVAFGAFVGTSSPGRGFAASPSRLATHNTGALVRKYACLQTLMALERGEDVPLLQSEASFRRFCDLYEVEERGDLASVLLLITKRTLSLLRSSSTLPSSLSLPAVQVLLTTTLDLAHPDTLDSAHVIQDTTVALAVLALAPPDFVKVRSLVRAGIAELPASTPAPWLTLARLQCLAATPLSRFVEAVVGALRTHSYEHNRGNVAAMARELADYALGPILELEQPARRAEGGAGVAVQTQIAADVARRLLATPRAHPESCGCLLERRVAMGVQVCAPDAVWPVLVPSDLSAQYRGLMYERSVYLADTSPDSPLDPEQRDPAADVYDAALRVTLAIGDFILDSIPAAAGDTAATSAHAPHTTVAQCLQAVKRPGAGDAVEHGVHYTYLAHRLQLVPAETASLLINSLSDGSCLSRVLSPTILAQNLAHDDIDLVNYMLDVLDTNQGTFTPLFPAPLPEHMRQPRTVSRLVLAAARARPQDAPLQALARSARDELTVQALALIVSDLESGSDEFEAVYNGLLANRALSPEVKLASLLPGFTPARIIATLTDQPALLIDPLAVAGAVNNDHGIVASVNGLAGSGAATELAAKLLAMSCAGGAVTAELATACILDEWAGAEVEAVVKQVSEYAVFLLVFADSVGHHVPTTEHPVYTDLLAEKCVETAQNTQELVANLQNLYTTWLTIPRVLAFLSDDGMQAIRAVQLMVDAASVPNRETGLARVARVLSVEQKQSLSQMTYASDPVSNVRVALALAFASSATLSLSRAIQFARPTHPHHYVALAAYASLSRDRARAGRARAVVQQATEAERALANSLPVEALGGLTLPFYQILANV